MSSLTPNDLYKEGICKDLDKKLRDYKKMRIWQGDAITYELTDNEVDVLAKLWRKERNTPSKITVDEATTLVVVFLLL